MSDIEVLIDFGSTFTKVTAVDCGEARVLGRAQAPTTADTDLAIGLNQALDSLVRNLCKALQREDLQSDPRFETNKVRTANRDALVPLLADVLQTKTRAEWSELMARADVPCGPVSTLRDTFADPQVRHNRMVQEIEHPVAGNITVAGVLVGLSETPGRISAPPPTLGQHTIEVLQALGYSQADIERFRLDGAI